VRALYQVVTRSPDIRRGVAVFAGTRIAVKTLIDHLDRGGTVEEFATRYPQVTRETLLAAVALGLEALIGTVPLEPALAQGSLLPRLDADGVIVNAEELVARQIVGRRVRCPACRALIFKSWPEGWDGHAAKRCRGLRGRDEPSRKAEFKRRFEPLFR
jgi:uncharacterized protein (DUF433 family)